MSGLLVKAEGLSKRFNQEWIFQNLSYEFLQGNTYVITGPNGSGKSTLLQLLWGQMPPSKGIITYSQNGNKILDEQIYQHISIAAPYMDLIDEFTLLEQVDFHFKAKPIRENFTSTQVIEAMYLTEASDKPIANFSSGMKQRVKLGLAFYTEAPVLFLDEPCTNLDKKAFDWYHNQLQALVPGKLLVIASNQASEHPKNAEEVDISAFKS